MGTARATRLGTGALDRRVALDTKPSYHRPSRATLSVVTRIALALIAILALAGCSSAPAPKTSDTATKDQTFLTIRDDLKMAPTTSGDAALISDAHAICAGFNDGLTAVQIVTATLKSPGYPFTLDQTSELVAMSVLVYCPEHKGALPPPTS